MPRYHEAGTGSSMGEGRGSWNKKFSGYLHTRHRDRCLSRQVIREGHYNRANQEMVCESLGDWRVGEPKLVNLQ